MSEPVGSDTGSDAGSGSDTLVARPARSGRAALSIALLAELVGSGAAFLIAGRHWQTITAPDPRLQRALEVTGRTVDAAPAALSLVALAGVVAVLATRGIVRRVIGGLVAAAGVGLVWWSLASAGAVSTTRARTLLADRGGVTNNTLVPQVVVHGAWPVLSAVCGVLVALSGAAVAVRGARWAAMSARYEAPAAQSTAGPSAQPGAATADGDTTNTDAAASIGLWSALDRGDDPTDRDPRDTA